MAAEGETNVSIARQIGLRRFTVSKWRLCFAEDGLRGLNDRPRAGAPKRYDIETERRILRLLDESPPTFASCVICLFCYFLNHYLLLSIYSMLYPVNPLFIKG